MCGEPRSSLDIATTRRSLLRLFGLMVLILSLIQVLSAIAASDETVFTQDLVYTPSSPPQLLRTPSFNLSGKTTNLGVSVALPIDHGAALFRLTLINEQTSREATAGLRIAGESPFALAKRTFSRDPSPRVVSQRIFDNVEPGSYHLVVIPFAATTLPFVVTVKHDIPVYANFLGALLLLFAVTGHLYLRANHRRHTHPSMGGRRILAAMGVATTLAVAYANYRGWSIYRYFQPRTTQVTPASGD